MIPVPFACSPGDKLRVTADQPYGTELVTGDLVTVAAVGVVTERGLPIPIVKVHTAHGLQILGFDVVEPFTIPTVTPAEPDDVVDAFFFGMLGADDDLRAWAVEAREKLAENDPAEAVETPGGGATVEAPGSGHQVGPALEHTDGDGDHLRITYRETTCGSHGREGGFFIHVNDQTVLVHASEIDAVIRYLFKMKKHSERPEENS